MSRYNRHPPPPLPGLSDVKNEHIDDEDSNASLIAQTLNADGTPKRPMNAFMIFARRRRPQVSAENQSMRTGEISKLLSKEWNTMLPELKQFYIDRAKELKDTFNASYPDYVYRRRPNNSRRRRPRSADATAAQADSPRSDEEDVKSEENYLVYSSADSRRHDPTHSPTNSSSSHYDATSYNPRPSQTGPSPRISPIVTTGYPGSSYYPASSGANPPYPESTSSNWSHSRGERGNSSWNTDRNPAPYPSSAAATWSSSTTSASRPNGASYSFPSLTHSSYYPPTSTSPGTGAGSETSSPVYRSDRPTTSSSASPPPYAASGPGSNGVLLDRYFSAGRDSNTAGDSGGGASNFGTSSGGYNSSSSRPTTTDVRGGRGLPSLTDQFSSTGAYQDSHRR